MKKIDKLLLCGFAVYFLASFLFLGLKIQTKKGEVDLFRFMDDVEATAKELGPIVIQTYCGQPHMFRRGSYLHSCEMGRGGSEMKQYHNALAFYLGIPAREVVMY